MKRTISLILSVIFICGVTCIPLSAGSNEADVYAVSTTGGYTLTPLDDDGNAIVSVLQEIDDVMETVYQKTEKFAFSYTATNASDFQLVLMLSGSSAVPTKDNIVYIDQTMPGAANAVAFTLYPSSLNQSEYHVFVSTSGGTGLSEVADFKVYREYILGDANDDGVVDSLDALRILRYAASLADLSPTGLKAADANGDGAVDSLDALRILRYKAGLILSLN